jgi:hypothetical protein
LLPALPKQRGRSEARETTCNAANATTYHRQRENWSFEDSPWHIQQNICLQYIATETMLKKKCAAKLTQSVVSSTTVKDPGDPALRHRRVVVAWTESTLKQRM